MGCRVGAGAVRDSAKLDRSLSIRDLVALIFELEKAIARRKRIEIAPRQFRGHPHDLVLDDTETVEQMIVGAVAVAARLTAQTSRDGLMALDQIGELDGE